MPLFAFPIKAQGRQTRTGDFGAQWLASTTPVNASPLPYGEPTHDSGPERLATPYSVGVLLLMGPDIEMKDRNSFRVDQWVSQTGAGCSCHHANQISRCRFAAHGCFFKNLLAWKALCQW